MLFIVYSHPFCIFDEEDFKRIEMGSRCEIREYMLWLNAKADRGSEKY